MAWCVCPWTFEKFHFGSVERPYYRRILVLALHFGATVREIREIVRMKNGIKLEDRLTPEQRLALVQLVELRRDAKNDDDLLAIKGIGKQLPIAELWKLYRRALECMRLSIILGVGGDASRRDYEELLARGVRMQAMARKMRTASRRHYDIVELGEENASEA